MQELKISKHPYLHCYPAALVNSAFCLYLSIVTAWFSIGGLAARTHPAGAVACGATLSQKITGSGTELTGLPVTQTGAILPVALA